MRVKRLFKNVALRLLFTPVTRFSSNFGSLRRLSSSQALENSSPPSQPSQPSQPSPPSQPSQPSESYDSGTDEGTDPSKPDDNNSKESKREFDSYFTLFTVLYMVLGPKTHRSNITLKIDQDPKILSMTVDREKSYSELDMIKSYCELMVLEDLQHLQIHNENESDHKEE